MGEATSSAVLDGEAPMILTRDEGAVRVVTFNRPQALNSFVAAMHAQLRDALDAAAADANVRAVVLTGAGRGFCAGQDLNDDGMGIGGQANDVQGVVERQYTPLALRLKRMPVPVIAAVNGVAAGAGANIALNCDVVIAARSASFIQAFGKIGLVPDCGGTWLLPRLVGRARALHLALTGDKLVAEEAQRIGLIAKVVDDAALMDEALALAKRLATLPVKALAETRRLIDEALPLDLASALQAEAVAQGRLSHAHDYAEGVQAFLDKRAPTFNDR